MSIIRKRNLTSVTLAFTILLYVLIRVWMLYHQFAHYDDVGVAEHIKWAVDYDFFNKLLIAE